MADEGEATATIAPKIVEYDPVTGVPSEFNEYLPQDSIEYKKWKAAKEGPEALEKLTLRDKEGNEIEKQLPGGKVKKKQKPQVGPVARVVGRQLLCQAWACTPGA